MLYYYYIKKVITYVTFSVDLAVDWVTNKLYFTDSGLQVVGVFDPVNMYYKVLISTNIDEPYAIALDPTNR